MTDVDVAVADHLLTTTKQVRNRLDLTRAVPRELLLECIEVASRAPIGGNLEMNRWLVVDDPSLKEAIAVHYRRVGEPYLEAMAPTAEGNERQGRVLASARFLVDHLHEVPALVIPLRLGRPDASVAGAAGFWGSVVPAVWSLQLALRARGVGSAWTTFHLEHESEVAELLGIPGTVTQVALLAAGYYTGAGFTVAPRRPAVEVTYFNGWKRTLDSP